MFERYSVKASEKANIICIMSTGLPRPGLAVHMRVIISNNNNYGTRPDTVWYAGTRYFFSTTTLHFLRRGFCTLALFIIYKKLPLRLSIMCTF